MPIIAVTGRKGGGGKTSLAGHLVGEFLAMGKTVMALDADPQKSLSKWARMGEGLLNRLVDVVEAKKDDKTFQQVVNTTASAVDLVLVDCPPGFADVSLWTLEVADIALLPVASNVLDLFAAGEMLELVELIRQERKGKPFPTVVANKVRANTSAAKEISAALERLDAEVMPAIGLREIVSSCCLQGLTLAEAAPSSTARRELTALAKRLEKML